MGIQTKDLNPDSLTPRLRGVTEKPLTLYTTMTYRSIIHLSFFISVVLLLSGCGGERLPPGIPKLYPATITVMQDGNPLAYAEVIIMNVDPTVNWSAGGATDKNGTLKLRTMGRYDGAPLGKYKVAVRKRETPDITLPTSSNNADMAREYSRIMKEIENNTFDIVDPKFYLGLTELVIEITHSNRKFTVDVSPAVRIHVPPPQKG